MNRSSKPIESILSITFINVVTLPLDAFLSWRQLFLRTNAKYLTSYRRRVHWADVSMNFVIRCRKPATLTYLGKVPRKLVFPQPPYIAVVYTSPSPRVYINLAYMIPLSCKEIPSEIHWYGGIPDGTDRDRTPPARI